MNLLREIVPGEANACNLVVGLQAHVFDHVSHRNGVAHDGRNQCVVHVGLYRLHPVHESYVVWQDIIVIQPFVKSILRLRINLNYALILIGIVFAA